MLTNEKKGSRKISNTNNESVDKPNQEQETEQIQNNNQPPHYNEYQNNYLNRISRPQKGYRKLMAGMM